MDKLNLIARFQIIMEASRAAGDRISFLASRNALRTLGAVA